MAKKNPGKMFEEDFQKSAEKEMFIYRLKDPPASFNHACNSCPKQVSRFSVRNICDFIAFGAGTQYLFELKSHKGKSIPFKNIIDGPKDTRLLKMVEAENKWNDVKSLVIFNWRECDNETYAMSAASVLEYINTAERKSIPIEFARSGMVIWHKLKRVRYSYNMGWFL